MRIVYIDWYSCPYSQGRLGKDVCHPSAILSYGDSSCRPQFHSQARWQRSQSIRKSNWLWLFQNENYWPFVELPFNALCYFGRLPYRIQSGSSALPIGISEEPADLRILTWVFKPQKLTLDVEITLLQLCDVLCGRVRLPLGLRYYWYSLFLLSIAIALFQLL